jgi:hypothetical protein
MGKTLKKRNYKLRNFCSTRNIYNDTDNIEEMFNNLKIGNNILVDKIYYLTLKNTVYCMKKYGIKFNIINYREAIGCSKTELYNHLIKNNNINLENISLKIGHINAFDVSQKDNAFYVHGYFNYRNLQIERI